MLHGFVEKSPLLIPGAGPAVQRSHCIRAGAAGQALAQYLGKQLMIAIPLAVVIQWCDEESDPLKFL
jgi:hypothetical protein